MITYNYCCYPYVIVIFKFTVQKISGKFLETWKPFYKGIDWVVHQRDNDTKHTSTESGVLEPMDWARQSLDLNPIEQIWNLVVLKMDRKKSFIQKKEAKKLVKST